MVYFTADLHFYHDKIISHTERSNMEPVSAQEIINFFGSVN